MNHPFATGQAVPELPRGGEGGGSGCAGGRSSRTRPRASGGKAWFCRPAGRPSTRRPARVRSRKAGQSSQPDFTIGRLFVRSGSGVDGFGRRNRKCGQLIGKLLPFSPTRRPLGRSGEPPFPSQGPCLFPTAKPAPERKDKFDRFTLSTGSHSRHTGDRGTARARGGPSKSGGAGFSDRAPRLRPFDGLATSQAAACGNAGKFLLAAYCHAMGRFGSRAVERGGRGSDSLLGRDSRRLDIHPDIWIGEVPDRSNLKPS